MSDKLKAMLAARKAELSGQPAPEPAPVRTVEPTVADAPSNLSIKDKIVWLQKEKANYRASLGEAKSENATATYTVVENAEAAPEIAESPAARTAAIVAAARMARGVGAAPAIGVGVLPQITALELAAKKIQNKAATGSYQFPNPQAVRELELDPQAIEEKLMHWDLAIETQNPEAKSLLQDINSLLRTYEELAHLMSEDQIGVVVQGSLALAGTEVQSLAATKTKSSAKAANAAMSSSDF